MMSRNTVSTGMPGCASGDAVCLSQVSHTVQLRAYRHGRRLLLLAGMPPR